MSQRVKVVGAPGHADHTGTVVPDGITVESHVIRSEFVFDVSEEAPE